MSEVNLLTGSWFALTDTQKAYALQRAHQRGREMARRIWDRQAARLIVPPQMPPATVDLYLEDVMAEAPLQVATQWREGAITRLPGEPRVCRFVHGYEAQRRSLVGEPPLPEEAAELTEIIEGASSRWQQVWAERDRFERELEAERRRPYSKRRSHFSEIYSVICGLSRSVRIERTLHEMVLLSIRAWSEFEQALPERREKTAPVVATRIAVEPAPPRDVVKNERFDPREKLSDELRRKLEEVLPYTRGRRAVILGGTVVKQDQRRMLQEIFRLAELEWATYANAQEFNRRCLNAIESADMVFYLYFNRRMAQRDLTRYAADRPIIYCHRGYGITRMIDHAYEHLVERRSLAAA